MQWGTRRATTLSAQWLNGPLALGLFIVPAVVILAACSTTPTSKVPQAQQHAEAESSAASAAKEKPKVVRPCGQELLSKGEALSPKPEYRIRKGESYRGAPEFSFEVGETGEIAKLKIVRSSGIRSVDKLAMENIKSWKYEPSSGCQPVEVTATASINWSD